MKTFLHATLVDNVYVYIMHSLPHQEAISLRELQQQVQHLRQQVSSSVGNYLKCVVTRGPPDCRRPKKMS